MYKSDKAVVKELIEILHNSAYVNEIFLLDNSPYPCKIDTPLSIRYIYNEGHNLGYGRAHNIAMHRTLADNVSYHLVLNPDIHFDASILGELVAYMDKHDEIGSLMPKIFYPNGQLQYFCKLLPEPIDLFGRRFLPDGMLRQRKERFELRASGYDKLMNIPNLSGCFMLLRTTVLKDVGLFDERYFLYFEDVDLIRRIHAKYKTVFYPYVSISHDHGRGSYKSLKLLWIHIVNMSRYFNKWGWLFDKERKAVNTRCLNNNVPSSTLDPHQ